MDAIDEAEKALAEIDREALGSSPLAVEVWSLAGRIAKERFAATRDRSSAAAREHAARAIENYSDAHAIGGDAYPAVNAATMAMLAGDAPRCAHARAAGSVRTAPGRRPLAARDAPAKRCSSSAAPTRRALATPKHIGWPVRGSATSPRCAGNWR